MSPKTKEQYEEIRQRSAAGIMQAALELFAQKGYAGTSISQIAKEAGVSKGLIYNYYPSKEALLEAIVMGAVKVGEELMESNLNTTESPREQLQHLIESTFAMVKSNLHYWKLMTSLAFQPGILDHFEGLIRQKSKENCRQLEELFTRMGVAHPKQEAYLLGATLDGIVLHFISLEDEYPFEEQVAYTIQKFCGP